MTTLLSLPGNGAARGRSARCCFVGLWLAWWPLAAWAQGSTIVGTTPPRNGRAAASGPVSVTFSQPVTAGSASALKVFSAQRGGLRSGHSGSTTASGSTVSFAPTYAFRPGETVQATVTTAATAAGGGSLGKAQVLQFTTAAGAGTGSFAGGANPAVGSKPTSVALGDVDNDGDLDALTANHDGNTVSVRLNNGSGVFGGGSDPAVGGTPESVAVGDVDGDGDLDLLTANYSSTSVSVRLNDGLGNFSGSSEPDVSSPPFNVVLGDIDGDGDLDFLTASNDSSTVSVRLNDGLGNFTPPATNPDPVVGSNPISLALGDVDGDGDLDLLAANYSFNGSVSVRLNDGTGNFTAPASNASPAVGGNPESLALGDIDGDGDLDFVAANYTTNFVSVRLNNGVGSFTPPATNPNPVVDFSPIGVTLGDIDGDGDLDFVAANYTISGTVSVRLNDGTGNFTAPASNASPAVGATPYQVALGDLDGDGDLDFVAANTFDNTISVRLNQSVFLASLSPPDGQVGMSLVLTGTGFTGATAVTFNGTAVPGFVVNSDTQITLTVPPGTTTGPVIVTAPGGISNGLTFTITLPDLVVSTPANVPSGTYRNITVTGPTTGGAGTATLVGPTVVIGNFVVRDGGRLNTACQRLSGVGRFTLAAGATLSICDSVGLESFGQGPIQLTGTRDYSDDATYVYSAAGFQTTGSELPPRVRALELTNGTVLALTQGLEVRRLVRLTSGSLLLRDSLSATSPPQPLTLLSDSSGTALIDNRGGVVVGASGTMQRHIETNTAAGGYRHYASPVSGETVNTLDTGGYTPDFSGAAAYNTSATPGAVTPFPTVFTYNQDRIATAASNYSTFDKGWQAALNGEAMPAGVGFAVQAPGAALVDFTGTFTTGPIVQSGLNRSGPADGWHLLGNPYPAPLDWSTMTMGAGRSLENMDGAVYVFQSSGPYAGTYRTYLADAPGGSSPLIPAGSGFFVRTTTPGIPGTVRFANANRVTSFGTQPAFGRGNDTRPALTLTLAAPGGSTDAATLYADALATTGTEAAYDAAKLLNPSGLNLASLTATGAALAVDGRPTLAGRIPLQVAVPAAGRYTLTATLANLPATTAVTLTDMLTGLSTDLRQTPAYAFTAAAAAPATGRFFLNLTAAGALASASPAISRAITLYPNPAHAAVTVSGLGGGATVGLLDALGRSMAQATAGADGTARLALPTGLAAGVYVVRSGTRALRLAIE